MEVIEDCSLKKMTIYIGYVCAEIKKLQCVY